MIVVRVIAGIVCAIVYAVLAIFVFAILTAMTKVALGW